ncbi:MAG TPA: NAD(P)-dependent oxidoreductase [Acidobacteriota bacterium]|nr:NAD(P)-dependent oxidoreductase [Acidobacteriota bacterium]
MSLLPTVKNEDELEAVLSEPYEEDIEAVKKLGGDLLILGAGGKMGPTLVQRAVLAFRRAGVPWKVYAASRFSDPVARMKLEQLGARTLSVDLMDESLQDPLPDCPNVLYMVGFKFGSADNPEKAWAVNSYLPGRVAERFRNSRIVSFSTGNVYPLVDKASGGATEATRPDPVGEYAQSCLGKERVLEYFCETNSTPVCLLRLNYAVEARYGVLLELAQKVHARNPISVTTGYVNVIWQGDANSVALRAFDSCDVPAEVLNLTGQETLSVRTIVTELGKRFRITPVFEGEEQPTALLSNATRCSELFGPPKVELSEMLDLMVHWIRIKGPTLGKPTKFEVRDGSF